MGRRAWALQPARCLANAKLDVLLLESGGLELESPRSPLFKARSREHQLPRHGGLPPALLISTTNHIGRASVHTYAPKMRCRAPGVGCAAYYRTRLNPYIERRLWVTWAFRWRYSTNTWPASWASNWKICPTINPKSWSRRCRNSTPRSARQVLEGCAARQANCRFCCMQNVTRIQPGQVSEAGGLADRCSHWAKSPFQVRPSGMC